MKRIWTRIKENVAAVLLIAAFISLCFGAHAYFAKSADLEALAAAYQFDKTTERYKAVQERIWALENMCLNQPAQCTTQVKAEIQHLKLELEELKRELSQRGS